MSLREKNHKKALIRYSLILSLIRTIMQRQLKGSMGMLKVFFQVCKNLRP